MTRDEYIEKVKAKLDEFSPFEEPNSFIAAAGDIAYDKVKPIVSYIDHELENATKFCLSSLPLSLLAKDVEKHQETIHINKGIGETKGTNYANKRLSRVKTNEWERDVTHFFSSDDAEYLLQQNKHTRSGIAKPSVFFIPEDNKLELYSFPESTKTTNAEIWSIDLLKRAEDVMSEVGDYIVIKCAQCVYDMLGNANGAATMENEYKRKLNAGV